MLFKCVSYEYLLATNALMKKNRDEDIYPNKESNMI